jgi:hypothetical protein
MERCLCTQFVTKELITLSSNTIAGVQSCFLQLAGFVIRAAVARLVVMKTARSAMIKGSLNCWVHA